MFKRDPYMPLVHLPADDKNYAPNRVLRRRDFPAD